MKLAAILILLGILTSNWVIGQVVYRVIEQPKNRVINVDGVWKENEDENSRRWDVVSERKDNQVYEDKDCTNPKSNFRLNFGETFYVLDYNPGKSLLVTKPNMVLANGIFNGTSSDLGWVKEETMVLSRKTMRTNSNKLLPGVNGLYTKKAFVINVGGGYTPPIFYSNPRMRSEDMLTSLNVNTAFYVYKETNNSVLLGTNPEKLSVIDENLLGWVDRQLIVEWNHNTGMERNWNNAAVDQRSSTLPNATPARIFSLREDAVKYKNGRTDFTGGILFDEETNNDIRNKAIRMPKDFFRSPVVETTIQDSLYQVGSIIRALDGNAIDGIRYNGRSVNKNEVIKIISEIIKQFNTFNFVFMIDGTHSILQYKQTIIDNIKSSVGSLAAMATGSNKVIKYYSIIYRDAAYQHPFSIMNGLTRSSTQLINFIDQNLSKENLNFKPGITTDDQPEAMNWGFKIIDQRLDSIGKFEKTFVIVLGDAGNHAQIKTGQKYFIDQDSVVDILNKKNYCVSAIQINHRTTESTYNQFQSQFKEILTNYYLQAKSVRIPDRAQTIQGSAINRWPQSNINSVPSVLIYPPNGQSLSNDILGKQIRDLITNAPYLDLGAKMPFEIPSGFLPILNIPNDDPQREDKIMFALLNYYYFPGNLTQFSKNKNTYRLFNDVQFFVPKELIEMNSLLDILIPANGATSNTSARQRLLDAWQEILVNRLKVVDQSRVGSVSLREASLFLTQNKGKEGWERITINDINNQRIFPDSLLGEYYYDWFATKMAVYAINNNTVITPNLIDQHSDLFEYCFELLHPEIFKDQADDERIRSINRFKENSFSRHFSRLSYNNINYINDILRCLCAYQTFSVKNGQIVSGEILKAFWIGGDCFPYENNYARLVFNN